MGASIENQDEEVDRNLPTKGIGATAHDDRDGSQFLRHTPRAPRAHGGTGQSWEDRTPGGVLVCPLEEPHHRGIRESLGIGLLLRKALI